MYVPAQITRKAVEQVASKIYAVPGSAFLRLPDGFHALGYNSGTYGWNWSAAIRPSDGTVVLFGSRNYPRSAQIVHADDLASIL